MTLQFPEMTSSLNFFDVLVFLMSSLVTDPSFMPISWLELCHFSFMNDLPEIQKSEIPSPEFCLIFGEWGKSGIRNLALMFLINCYSMLQNARIAALTVCELLRENQQGIKFSQSRTQIKVKVICFF